MKRFSILLLMALAIVSCGKNNPLDPAPNSGDSGEVNPEEGMTSLTVYGKVLDETGKPYVGAVMSDGYNFVLTDENGYYRFEKYRYASYVLCSVPSDAKIVTSGAYNLPESHYKRLTGSNKEYNFTFPRQATEQRFRLLALGDPQVHSDDQVTKYGQTARSDIRQYVVDSEKIPTYGITLGDNVGDAWEYFAPIAGEFGRMTVPVFATIGNHDHEFPVADETASRKKYEAVFGPSNYSFNRGDVHFIVFDDVLHSGQTSSGYDYGFEPWQLEWLKKDLSYVPADKSIVMTLHIPLKDARILSLLTPYKSALVLAGHTHNVENTYDKTINGKKITVCAVGSTGAPWRGLILSDGCQRGYKVYEFDGASISREIYKCIGYDESFQMRMFRTNDFPSFTTPGGSVFAFPYYGDNWIAVNVFNYKTGWKVALYEDGVQTSTNPIVKNSYDVWVKMFLYNYHNRDNSVGKTDHMLFFQLKNPKASSIRIEVTDDYGKVYTCERFTTSADVPDYPSN